VRFDEENDCYLVEDFEVVWPKGGSAPSPAAWQTHPASGECNPATPSS
jgi:hypothetical protein